MVLKTPSQHAAPAADLTVEMLLQCMCQYDCTLGPYLKACSLPWNQSCIFPWILVINHITCLASMPKLLCRAIAIGMNKNPDEITHAAAFCFVTEHIITTVQQSFTFHFCSADILIDAFIQQDRTN